MKLEFETELKEIARKFYPAIGEERADGIILEAVDEEVVSQIKFAAKKHLAERSIEDLIRIRQKLTMATEKVEEPHVDQFAPIAPTPPVTPGNRPAIGTFDLSGIDRRKNRKNHRKN